VVLIYRSESKQLLVLVVRVGLHDDEYSLLRGLPLLLPANLLLQPSLPPVLIYRSESKILKSHPDNWAAFLPVLHIIDKIYTCQRKI
jgi:hypothetical protein